MLCYGIFLFSKNAHIQYTPEDFSIEPENDGLEDQRGILRFHVDLPGVYSQAANMIQMTVPFLSAGHLLGTLRASAAACEVG